MDKIEPRQWVIIGAIVVVVVAVAVLVGPSFVPKPAPIPEKLPSTAATSAPTLNAQPSNVPTATREEVVSALQRDGIPVTDPKALKIDYAGDQSHVRVYGQVGGKFQQYRYVLKDGAWQQQ